MENIKSIKSFIQESEAINEARAGFYESAAAIGAILSSDMVAGKMRMQEIAKITKVEGEKIVYNVSSSGSQPITLSVTLDKITSKGDIYGDSSTYKVSSAQVIPTR